MIPLKIIHLPMKHLLLKIRIMVVAGVLFSTVISAQPTRVTEYLKHDYYVAAYIWPTCHDDPMGRKMLWPKGIG